MTFDIQTLRGLAKLMALESDDPSDIRGLRARAVAWAADEIESLTNKLEQAKKLQSEREAVLNRCQNELYTASRNLSEHLNKSRSC